jgi:hypothetical protein
MNGTARFSADFDYRYSLTRQWDTLRRPMVFAMFNPSTADAEIEDPTIRRCMGFAEREDCGGIVVVNLFGYRATQPAELRRVVDPVGPGNDEAIREAFALPSAEVVLAWGATADAYPVRVREFLNLIPDTITPLCLGTTGSGAPRHPLYVRADKPLEEYQL